MIPILYEPDETSFTGNGVGPLNDAIECTVEEERNGVYQLQMVYPVDGIHFTEIKNMSVIKAIPADGKAPQLFDVFRISAPLNGRVQINARHISQRLNKNTVMPFTATSVTDAFLQIKANCVESDDFTYWTDKTSSGSMDITTPKSVRAVLGGSEGSVLDSFGGGEYEWDGFTVKLWADRGFDRGVTLRYGKNITDIKQESNIENTVTGITPYWKGQDADGHETVVTLTEKAVYSQNAGNFPYARTIPVDLSEKFQAQPTEAQLRSTAQSYITSNNIGVPSVSIDVSFVPLWQTEEYKNIANLERVNLCDIVTVEFEKLGISVKAKVVKTVYDVLKERYESITIGDVKSNFTADIASKISSTANEVKRAIPKESVFRRIVNEQTEKITGGLGGHVVMTLNANDEPQEILIMDTDDIQTAINVIRLNQAGIGFSTNGYNGPFQSAWTIDGHFNADFIATGHLLANFIQGGTLKMGGANNGNGVIEVYDASGQLIGRWDNTGLIASGELEIRNSISDSVKFNIFGGEFDFREYLFVEGYSRPVTRNGFAVEQRNGSGNQVGVYGFHKDMVLNWRIPRYSPSLPNRVYENLASIRVGDSSYDYSLLVGLGTGELSFNYYKYLKPATEASNANMVGEQAMHISINGSNLAFESSSSRRYKHDIKPLENADLDPHKLLNLTPVQFIFNSDHPLQFEDMADKTLPGFIAEDVEAVYPSAAIYKDGKIENWDERRIIPGMLALIQEQDKRIKDLEARLAKMEEMLK